MGRRRLPGAKNPGTGEVCFSKGRITQSGPREPDEQQGPESLAGGEGWSSSPQEQWKVTEEFSVEESQDELLCFKKTSLASGGCSEDWRRSGGRSARRALM